LEEFHGPTKEEQGNTDRQGGKKRNRARGHREGFSSMATPKANNRTIQGKLITTRAVNGIQQNKKISGSDFGESMRT
jgi:hypothetical protein